MTWEDVEGSVRALVWRTIRKFQEQNEENDKKIREDNLCCDWDTN